MMMNGSIKYRQPYLTLLLESLDDHELLLWGSTGEDDLGVVTDDLNRLLDYSRKLKGSHQPAGPRTSLSDRIHG